MRQLYVEVLYTITHKIGANTGGQFYHYKEELYQYAQSAFNAITSGDHKRFFDMAAEEKVMVKLYKKIKSSE